MSNGRLVRLLGAMKGRLVLLLALCYCHNLLGLVSSWCLFHIVLVLLRVCCCSTVVVVRLLWGHFVLAVVAALGMVLRFACRTFEHGLVW